MSDIRDVYIKYESHKDDLTSKEYNDFIIGYVNNLILFSDKQIITSGKQNVGYYYRNFDITEFETCVCNLTKLV